MLSKRARLALTGIRDNMRLAEEFAADLSVEALTRIVGRRLHPNWLTNLL